MSLDENNVQTKLFMEDISIEFPGVKALSNVDFTMHTGEIHALVGANGAGKSTLMKVLSGSYTTYTGKIYFNEEQIDINSPAKAKSMGIDIVHQEVDTSLISHMSVGENIMLNDMVNNMGKKQMINWRNIHIRAKKLLERLNIHLDTKKNVHDLNLVEKQMVLIARAISEQRRFLILDEPTAPLSHTETKELFRVVKNLAKEENVGIIFISHRLPELFEICERITVMRNGEKVHEASMSDMTSHTIVEKMLGNQMAEEYHKPDIPVGNRLLEIKNMNGKNNEVRQIDLSINQGEIVGVTGLVGAGKTELCKSIFGSIQTNKGCIEINGKKINTKSPNHAVKDGVALVPEERRKEGILVEEPVYSNLTAASLNKHTGLFGFLRPNKERKHARDMITSLGVKTPNENQKVGLLSGGNQQKVAVGKWLSSDAEVFLFDEPTKGVDVGAKTEIFDLIVSLAQNEKAVMYATSEISEILSITDRIYVMYDYQIVKELITKNTTEEEIMYYSTGGQ